MRLLLLLFSCSLLSAEEPVWPTRTEPARPTLKALPEKDGAAIWATPHFIIVCELTIPQHQLSQLAQTMESIPQLFKTLPLPLWAPPKTEKAVLRICANETSFVARGGPLDAAGCYHPRRGEILIRGDLLLNPPQTSATRLRSGPNEDLLVHELTHLAMHQYGGRIPPWLTEGLAEYFAACHTTRGHYDFTQSKRLIRKHIEKFYPQDRFPVLQLPTLKELIKFSSRDWLRANKTVLPEDRYRQYAAALLLTHYCLEGGQERHQELSDYMAQTLKTPYSPHGKQRPLFIQDADEIETRLTKFWKANGLPIAFY